MDDIDFEYMPNKKMWFGAQKEFTATDKYTRKKTIIFGKPLIFICNPDQDPRKHRLWNSWFDANSVVVEIMEPLFV